MKTGARALRSIMETIMLDIMYDIPAIEGSVEVVINAGVVKEGQLGFPIEPEKLDAACCSLHQSTTPHLSCMFHGREK